MTALAAISLNWISTSDTKEWSDEEKRTFAEKYPRLLKIKDTTEGEPLELDYIYGVHIVDSNVMAELSDKGIKYTVEQFKGQINVPIAVEGVEGPVQTLHVHAPNHELSAYNEVMVTENACTDALQGFLDSGWRILCVCPPLNARRPDYILGRINPDKINQQIAHPMRT